MPLAASAPDPATIDDILTLEELRPHWLYDPVACVEDSFTQDPYGEPVHLDLVQRKILTYVGAYDRVAVRTCHGVGKSATAAMLVLWWLSTRRPSRVVTAAGTWNHLEDKLWPEIRLWAQKWRWKAGFDIQTLAIHGLLAGGDHDPGWRAVAASSDRAENVEGHHSPQLLLLIDEAKAMPDAIWQALLGMQPTKIVVLSTPPLINAGWYCGLFEDNSGWNTVHADAMDSDRVSALWVDEMARNFGTDSAVYIAKVLGLIPEGGTWALIPRAWAEMGQMRTAEPDFKDVVLTCDVARFGENLTTIGRFKLKKFSIRQWKATTSIPEVARMCAAHAILEKADYLVIDDNGVGGGVTDILREWQAGPKEGATFPQKCAIVPENFGEKPNRDDKYARRKDELWWEARESQRLHEIALPTGQELKALDLPRGHDFIRQLTSPVYEEDYTGRLVVTDKHPGGNPTGVRREMYAHLSTVSPDLAHAYILGADLYRRLQPRPPQTQVPAHGPQYAAALEAARAARLRERVESWKKPKPKKGNARIRMLRGGG